ncbi:PIN domain-containing protein [Candidatus Micrarchaeota archaeon]|nr:PIN domain-containing protein [Candidatus Micrarchaeota archaeon]
MTFFLDTYAIVEIFSGNPAFEPFVDSPSTCTVFNAVEAYFIFRSKDRKDLARNALILAHRNAAELSKEIIQKAMDFRADFNAKNRKNALSYADAIGYTYALENRLEFVTGDDAFKGLKGVRFLK